MKDGISKANYILEAYNLLSTEGIEAVTIRRLADTLCCNSANLYRYFDGLEELIVFASLRYLKSYISEVRELYEKSTDNLSLHFSVWECFSRYTFSYPEIFNNLFWGKYSNKLDDIIREYYELFPDELVGIDPYMCTVFLSGDFDYRDYLMLVRSVNDGRFSETQAKYLNALTMNLYKGFFKTLLDHPECRDPNATQSVFLSILHRIFTLEEFCNTNSVCLISENDISNVYTEIL